jgi:hypothetical protein
MYYGSWRKVYVSRSPNLGRNTPRVAFIINNPRVAFISPTRMPKYTMLKNDLFAPPAAQLKVNTNVHTLFSPLLY